MVPFTGTAPVINAMLSGQVDYECDPVLGPLPHVRAGTLKALAIATTKRSPLLPDVPTSAEAGLPGYEVETWFALYGPANMPPDVVSKINAALNAVLSEPDAAQQFVKVGLDPKVSTPAEAAAYLKADSDKWGDVIRRIKLQVD